jgi:RNA polymerase sigma-70 factor (ECF subfamily)
VIRLPIRLREVILLYYYQGLNVNEIAEALGISQPSVSGRLKRGRDRLKDMLEGRENDA